MPAIRYLLVALLLVCIGGCGKTSEQREQERVARETALRQALEKSLAEEQQKDSRMREGAAAEAFERLVKEAADDEQEVGRAAAAPPTPEQQQAERANLLRQYTETLKRTLADPASMQLRNAEFTAKQTGMCAEYNVRNKAGEYQGYKRVVVIDNRVATEE